MKIPIPIPLNKQTENGFTILTNNLINVKNIYIKEI